MLKHKKIAPLCITALVILIILNFFTSVHWTMFVFVLLIWLGFTAWGSFDIRLSYFTKTYTCKPNCQERKIALTFDDGPHEMTEKILKLLQQYNVKATFFCIGKQIKKKPELFKKITEQGHLVGNHSYSHSKEFGFFSTQKVIDEIEATQLIAEKITAVKMRLFRPPFGVTNPMISKAISKTKHHVIGWNIRSLDTVYDNENIIFERIKSKVVPGGIILLHDTSLKSVNVLEQLLLFLESENYKVVPIDELLTLAAYENL